MSGLALLIPIALLLGLGGLTAFFWAVRSDQFDDLDGAALRILIDEEDWLPQLAVERFGHVSVPQDCNELLRSVGAPPLPPCADINWCPEEDSNLHALSSAST